MDLLFIEKQQNGQYLLKDFVTFWPMFLCFYKPWNSNFFLEGHARNFVPVWTTQHTEST